MKVNVCIVFFNIVSNALNTILCVNNVYLLSNQNNYDKCFPKKCLFSQFLFTSQLWPSQFRVSSPGLGFSNALIINYDFKDITLKIGEETYKNT